tara:strand:+ start:112 stop:255 length:144 start_codon:yes stop_codon:yes gene_type:complete
MSDLFFWKIAAVIFLIWVACVFVCLMAALSKDAEKEWYKRKERKVER